MTFMSFKSIDFQILDSYDEKHSINLKKDTVFPFQMLLIKSVVQ